MDPKTILIDFVIPFLGIAIILFCILSFLFPFGEKLRDKTQKVKLPWSIDMEVSAVTLFFLVGVFLCVSSLYVYMQDYDKRLARLKEEYENKLALLKMDLQANVSLEGGDALSLQDYKNFGYRYQLFGRADLIEGDVNRGVVRGSFIIPLREIKPESSIMSLEVTDKTDPHRKWVSKEAFWPFMPTVVLKRDVDQ